MQGFARKDALNSFTVASKYDTGWIANSDWTFFKPTITHNLNAPLSELIIKLMLSSDGTDANSFDLTPQGHYRANDGTGFGIHYYAIGNNSFNIVTAANGVQRFLSTDGSASALGGADSFYYKVIVYKLVTGTVILGSDGSLYTPSYIKRSNGLTRGATNTNVVIYGTAVKSTGSDITYVNSATNGDSFLINTSGIYCVTVNAGVAAAYPYIEIHSGATIDNSTLSAYVCATKRSWITSGSDSDSISWTGYIPSGDSVWILNTQSSGGADYNTIEICRVR